MILRVLVAALALSGCSYTFDGEPAPLPLVGPGVSLAGAPQIERQKSEGYSFIRGEDGVPWVALFESDEFGRVFDRVRMVRLAGPYDQEAATEEYRAPFFHVGKTLIYQIEPGKNSPTLVTVRRPGHTTARQFELVGGGIFSASANDAVFAYWTETAAGFELVRTDGSFRRKVGRPEPPPSGFRPFFNGRLFDPDGEYLFTFDGDGQVTAHATRSDEDRRLGAWAPRAADGSLLEGRVGADAGRRALVFCDGRGVLVMPWDGGPERLLDLEPCRGSPYDEFGSRLSFADDQLLYYAGGDLRAIPLQGGTPRRLLTLSPGRRVIALHPARAAYTEDHPDRWKRSASNGFTVEGWQFMERGREAAFSKDAKRIRFLEFAADAGGVGELRSAEIGSAWLRLARNVVQFDELPDGRVLAASNQAFRGAHNRVIAVDERAGLAVRVADGAVGYTLIPGSTDVLVEMHSPDNRLRWARIPVPR